MKKKKAAPKRGGPRPNAGRKPGKKSEPKDAITVYLAKEIVRERGGKDAVKKAFIEYAAARFLTPMELAIARAEKMPSMQQKAVIVKGEVKDVCDLEPGEALPAVAITLKKGKRMPKEMDIKKIIDQPSVTHEFRPKPPICDNPLANPPLSFYTQEEIKAEIKRLEDELKHPPKNPIIGIKLWTKIRQGDLEKLKKELK